MNYWGVTKSREGRKLTFLPSFPCRSFHWDLIFYFSCKASRVIGLSETGVLLEVRVRDRVRDRGRGRDGDRVRVRVRVGIRDRVRVRDSEGETWEDMEDLTYHQRRLGPPLGQQRPLLLNY
jgi:hypothetical protein